MNGISVIICCYNSSLRLPVTLDHLIKQQNLGTIPWEIIIINNNSSDNTVEIANTILCNTSINYKIIDEPKPGIFYARITGIKESTYDVLIFVDDDNWLCEDYLKIAYQIMKNNPTVGLCGGVGNGAFEVEPPKWFKQYEGFYAIGDHKRTIEGILPKASSFLYGAGLVLRKQAYLELTNKGFKPLLVGREGKSLNSGDDSELCAAINIIGWNSYFSRDLKFSHFIPKSRLTEDYFNQLLKGLSNSSQICTIYNLVLQKKKPLCFYYLRKFIKNHIDILLIILRKSKTLNTNTINTYHVEKLFLKYIIQNNYKNILKLNHYMRIIKSLSINNSVLEKN